MGEGLEEELCGVKGFTDMHAVLNCAAGLSRHFG